MTADRTSDYPRTWDFSAEGELAGRYVELRQVQTSDGPRELVELELPEGERVTVWLSAQALRRRFADELRLRTRQGASDFEPGERISIARGAEMRTSASGFDYWPFEVVFERAAKRSAADVLLGDEPDDEHAGGDELDELPF
jgi:hypothetical protein